jgi:hypothetical protein
MDAIIATAFPLLASYSKGLPFAFFALAMVAQLFVVVKYFPETKGVALEDMGRSLDHAGSTANGQVATGTP